MESYSRYEVRFRTEPGLSEEARRALEAAGIALLGGHAGPSGPVPSGGDLPEANTWRVWVHAEGEAEAAGKVQDAIAGVVKAYQPLGVEKAR